MAKAPKYTCLVCGRVFYEGQGIVIRRGGLELAFHSSRCAAKFLRLLLERSEEGCVEDTAKRVSRELEEALKRKQEEGKKVIA